MQRITPVLIGTVWLLGCVPDVEQADTLIDGPRVLAVRATPAELAEREPASFEALYVDATGTLREAAIEWAFCIDRKSLAELGPVSSACLAERGDAFEPIGAGLSISGQMPAQACRLFGPDRPPPKDDEPAGRPVDPDPTGGYYQPVRLFDRAQDAYEIFELRVACGLPAVTQMQYAEFNRRYRRNENPALRSLAIVGEEGTEEPLDPVDAGEPRTLAPGETLELRARWDDCAPDSACSGAEHYLHFDPAKRAFATRREGMRLSWFATAGSFADPRTGRTESDADEASSDNAFSAPEEVGDLTLWVVLRDDRGGTSWQTYAFRVEP